MTSNYMEIRSLGTKLSLLDLILQYLNLHFIYCIEEGLLFELKSNFAPNTLIRKNNNFDFCTFFSALSALCRLDCEYNQ